MCVRAGYFGRRVRSEWFHRSIHGAEFFGGRSIIVDRFHRRHPTRHDNLLRRHRLVVRADGRDPAPQEILGQRLSRQLGLPAGADRRQPLCDHRRRRSPGSGRDLRVVPRRYADRSRSRPDLRADRPGLRRPGQRLPLRAHRLERRQRRRPAGGREGQPAVGIAAAAGGDGGARHRQAADRRYGVGRGHRQAGFAAGFHHQQGVQSAPSNCRARSGRSGAAIRTTRSRWTCRMA